MSAKRNSDSGSGVDWSAMEPEWRAGIVTKKHLSEKYGVSRAAIDKHWDKLGIDRDLTARIRQKAEALVTQQAVTQEVAQSNRVTEERIVEANAQMQADVILAHRRDLQRYKKLCLDMLAELESETKDPELFEELGILLRSEDKNGQDKLNDAYHKAISLPGRIDGVKKLAEVLKTMVALERQAFGIRDDDDGKPKDHIPLEDRLKKYAQDAAIEAAGNVTRLPRAA